MPTIATYRILHSDSVFILQNTYMTKKSLYLITTTLVFAFAFFISSQRIEYNNNHGGNNQQAFETNELRLSKDTQITQNILQDFEKAFLKQYTPLLGCEDISNSSRSSVCNRHLEKAKNEFKLEFIQRRGLPKDTFTKIQLSATN